MKSVILSSLTALALVTGCAASSDDSASGASAEINARAEDGSLELANSTDPRSVQAALYRLLDTFKDDPGLRVLRGFDAAALMMTGKAGPRSVTCTESTTAIPPQFRCTFDGIGKHRGGGSYPSEVVPNEGEAPFTGKLFVLLKKGFEKGGLGVVQTVSESNPGCCDLPTEEAFELRDEAGVLSCAETGGGLTGILEARCDYEMTIAPHE